MLPLLFCGFAVRQRQDPLWPAEDTFTVTCLAAAKHMAPLLADESRMFEGGDVHVRNTWTEYAAQDDAVLAEPETYISLR